MVMSMTILDPNKTYIFERVNNILYAREVGCLNRICLGDDLTTDLSMQEWRDILCFAMTNETLKQELSRVKMLYCLLKEDQNG